MKIKEYNKIDSYKLKQSNDDKYCTLKFSSCDDKFPLYVLTKEELKAFIAFAKKIENLTWKDIKTYRGLKFEEIENLVKPDNISKDITLCSLRVSKKFRIVGYRQDEYFYIVWFDAQHKSY